MENTHLLDTKGLYCPEPVMMLHSKIDEIGSGELIELLSTDPASQRDIPKFCQFLGHQLIEQYEKDDCYIYRIKKA